ncbi:MAG: ACT domain-containing protein [Desulfovibrio sp.]|nr:ACT domain-containing protein [Desulfovibrio sp.]
MPALASNCAPQDDACAMIVLELRVNNHPGVMSHVCGLFARRAFNLEGILVLPVPATGQGGESRMWLMVRDDEQLPQVEKQLAKLHDVLSLDRRDPELFDRLQLHFQ